jgi:hypothetical protein
MDAPIRLQLSRAKGFNLQALSLATNGLPAKVVTRPGKWGNPFTVWGWREAGYKGTDSLGRLACVRAFEVWLSPNGMHNIASDDGRMKRLRILQDLHQIRGHNLACWCALPVIGAPGSNPCHADILLEIANGPICEALP